MERPPQYRLSHTQKEEIAKNLIGVLCDGDVLTGGAENFIRSWVQGARKVKAHYDVWDLVLKSYMPDTTPPILFRTCNRVRSGRIASFTGSLDAVWKFSRGKGLVITCDTKDCLWYDVQCGRKGEYRHTFYPLVEVIRRGIKNGNFSDDHWDQYIREDEYIMRIPEDAYVFRWNGCNSQKSADNSNT